MTEENNPPALPNSPEDLGPTEKATLLQVQTAFADDPGSIPEKFQNTENPAFEYVKSQIHLKALQDRQTQQSSGTEEEVEEVTEETEETTEELPDSLTIETPEAPEMSFEKARELTAFNKGVPTDEVREFLKTKHGYTDAMIDDHFTASIRAEIQQGVQNAVETVGGVDNFNKIREFVLANKTPEEIAEINQATADPKTRALALKGLMFEAGIGVKKQVEPSQGQPREVQVEGYGSQAELNSDLIKANKLDRFHPEHDRMHAQIMQKIKATKPGVLL